MPRANRHFLPEGLAWSDPLKAIKNSWRTIYGGAEQDESDHSHR